MPIVGDPLLYRMDVSLNSLITEAQQNLVAEPSFILLHLFLLMGI